MKAIEARTMAREVLRDRFVRFFGQEHMIIDESGNGIPLDGEPADPDYLRQVYEFVTAPGSGEVVGVEYSSDEYLLMDRDDGQRMLGLARTAGSLFPDSNRILSITTIVAPLNHYLSARIEEKILSVFWQDYVYITDVSTLKVNAGKGRPPEDNLTVRREAGYDGDGDLMEVIATAYTDPQRETEVFRARVYSDTHGTVTAIGKLGYQTVKVGEYEVSSQMVAGGRGYFVVGLVVDGPETGVADQWRVNDREDPAGLITGFDRLAFTGNSRPIHRGLKPSDEGGDDTGQDDGLLPGWSIDPPVV